MAMSTGKVVALIKAMGGSADPAVIEAAVHDWLDAHPEATTTVQDGSITEQKLATSIARKLGLISSLSDEIDAVKDAINLVGIPSINIYDNANPTIVNGFLGDVFGQKKFSASSAAKCLAIQLDANTTYTFSKKQGVGRDDIGLFSGVPTDQTLGEIVSKTTTTQDGRYNATFTTGSDNLTLVVYYYNANDGIPEADIRATIMVSLGNTIYPYTPYSDGKLLITEEIDSPVLGDELLSGSGWVSDGWTGDFTNGFTHTTGNTNALSVTINSLEENALYQFMITTSNAATNGWSDFSVSLGGSDTFQTYRGGGASVSYTYGIICGSSKTLAITPRNDYTGTVTGLSLKKVTNVITPALEIADSDGEITCQIRTAKSNRNAVYIGENSGVQSFWGYENVSLGTDALANNTSGFWNTAVGRRALQSNQNGSRNIGIGYIALRSNTGGDRNVAIGTFALEKNTTGRNNVAINADAMQDNTTGHDNVGIGVRALVGNTTGFYNVGIGNNALAANKTGTSNVAIGQNALANATGANNVAIGNNAGDASGMTGSNNIVIGYDTDVPTPSANNQMVLGNSSISTVVIAGKTINFNQDGSVTWS